MNVDANDMELVGDYARNGSEQAFRTLVERRINFVYSIALRQTGNTQRADDVTQAVFIALAEKAASIPKNTILTGWLFRATRFAAANLQRSEARREYWEQKAAQMEPTPSSPSESESEQVTPLLHEALEQLPETDRAAILLRFFESKSMEEVGRTLGTTESAAKMRLSRAVEKLRHVFRKRGVVVPTATLLAVLSTQAAQAAPVGLASAVATSALLHQSGASTLILAKGTLKVMTLAKAQKLAIAALALLFAGGAAVVIQQAVKPVAAQTASPAATAAPAAASKVLVFRNVPSWNRTPDFEDTLADLGYDFEVKPSSLMASTDLSRYRLVVIPGAQWNTDFYQTYSANAERFDRYVTNGGILVLELNGAENDGIMLPRGVNIVRHPARTNLIVWPEHPIVAPLGGRPIRASYASHCYLNDVPKDALILATEGDDESNTNKATFVEYGSGSGRVIAACQCFHDRDRSGRGPLMQTVLTYATEKKWFIPKR